MIVKYNEDLHELASFCHKPLIDSEFYLVFSQRPFEPLGAYLIRSLLQN